MKVCKFDLILTDFKCTILQYICWNRRDGSSSHDYLRTNDLIVVLKIENSVMMPGFHCHIFYLALQV